MCELTKRLHPDSMENPLRGRGLVACAMAEAADRSFSELLHERLDPNELGVDGLAAMHHAAEQDDESNIKRLLAYDADVDVQSAKGETPLVYALVRGARGTLWGGAAETRDSPR